MATKQVVFVHAANVEDTHPWMFFHFDPKQDIDPSPVKLAYFDYTNGTLKTWNKWIMKRGKYVPTNPDTEEDLQPKVKIRLSIDPAQPLGPERPSVLALYDWVKKQPKGTILSLQIFSHGWFNGPVLWADCFETIDKNDLTLARDPNDTEFRPRDLFGKNPLAGKDGRAFADAFVDNALIKLWGCNEGRYWPENSHLTGAPWRNMIANYMKAPKGAKGDATRKAHLTDYLDWIEQCFQFLLAKELSLSIWAGPLGWGSDPSTTVPVRYVNDRPVNIKVSYRGAFPPDLTKDQWWRVSALFRGDYRKFYTDMLKANIDKTGYVKFEHTWFNDARRFATASLEPGLITSPQELQQQLIDRIDQLGLRRT